MAMRSERVRIVCSALVGIFCCFLARVANADSWGPPTPDHWSGNRQYVLHVTWPDKKELTLLKVMPTGERRTLVPALRR